MTVPGWWQAAVLVLASYRLTRLAGWDAWPPVARLRAWAIGQEWVPLEDEREWNPPCWQPEIRYVVHEHEGADLPGKQPSSPLSGVRPAYRRPVLAHLAHCPWCLGWWICLIVWGFWLAAGDVALFVCTPLALSTVVGFLGKNLDA